MYLRCFIFLLILSCIKAGIAVFTILHAGIGLGPDEAQYWTWSRALDWGYYSKPPGIAWQIWLGTHVFGNTELGVRSMAVVIGIIIPLLVFLMAKWCRLVPWACFWAGTAMALSPLGMMASILSITDGGMILFWTAACAYMVRQLDNDAVPSYPLFGLLICLGALFKWPIYALWIFAGASMIWLPRLRSWKIVIGVIISLLALLPSVYWNAGHDWSTFRHVSATLGGGHARPESGSAYAGNFPEFLGAQALLLSPILFVLLAMALLALVRMRKKVAIHPGLFFCGGITFASLAFAALLSLFMKMQGNWAIFAYPTAFAVIAWYACEMTRPGKKWLAGGIALSIILCSITFSIPYLQSHNIFSALRIPYKISPFRHNVGWDHLDKALQAAGYDPAHDFLFGDKYQTASILSFYGAEQRRAYFINLHGTRKNQFSFWPGPDKEQKGKRGFFVVPENAPRLYADSPQMIKSYEVQLSRYFDEVRFLGIEPLFVAYGQIVKGALIFECTGFSGQMPKDPELY